MRLLIDETFATAIKWFKTESKFTRVAPAVRNAPDAPVLPFVQRVFETIGLAKVATLVNQVRRERRDRATLVLDAGDTIQGTPLATYYAKQEPITETGEKHPMARGPQPQPQGQVGVDVALGADARAALARTGRAFEVIVIDDGSTDDTPRLLRDWLALFNRLVGNDTAGVELATVAA